MSRFMLVEDEYSKLSKTYGIKTPPWATTPGHISYYRHSPRDILISEDLLSEGSEMQVRKVASHEFIHFMQASSGLRNMKNKPFTELEAESMALDWMSGKKPEMPVVPHPFSNALNIRQKNSSISLSVAKPYLSACGYCSLSDGGEQMVGFGILDMIREKVQSRFGQSGFAFGNKQTTKAGGLTYIRDPEMKPQFMNASAWRTWTQK